MVSRDFIDRARHGLYSSRARYGGGVIGACYMVRTFFDGVASGVICYHFGADRGNDICWCMDIERDGALLGLSLIHI